MWPQKCTSTFVDVVFRQFWNLFFTSLFTVPHIDLKQPIIIKRNWMLLSWKLSLIIDNCNWSMWVLDSKLLFWSMWVFIYLSPGFKTFVWVSLFFFTKNTKKCISGTHQKIYPTRIIISIRIRRSKNCHFCALISY